MNIKIKYRKNKVGIKSIAAGIKTHEVFQISDKAALGDSSEIEDITQRLRNLDGKEFFHEARQLMQDVKAGYEDYVQHHLKKYLAKHCTLKSIEIVLIWESEIDGGVAAYIRTDEVAAGRYIIHLNGENFITKAGGFDKSEVFQTLIHESIHLVQFMLKSQWYRGKNKKRWEIKEILSHMQQESTAFSHVLSTLRDMHSKLALLLQNLKIEGEARHVQHMFMHITPNTSRKNIKERVEFRRGNIKSLLLFKAEAADKLLCTLNVNLTVILSEIKSINDILKSDLSVDEKIEKVKPNCEKISREVDVNAEVWHKNSYDLGFLIVRLLSGAKTHKLGLSPDKMINLFIKSRHMPLFNDLKKDLAKAMETIDKIESTVKECISLIKGLEKHQH